MYARPEEYCVGHNAPIFVRRQVTGTPNPGLARQKAKFEEKAVQNLVFLDFDDVLAVSPDHTSSHVVTALKTCTADKVPGLWLNIFNETARKNLRILYDEFRPKFVISSTWATYMSREQVEEVLTRSGMAFVAAALHPQWRSAVELGSSRASDIRSWLEKNTTLSSFNYVILDDVASGATMYGSSLESRAVFCDEWEGFLDARLVQAQQILKGC